MDHTLLKFLLRGGKHFTFTHILLDRENHMSETDVSEAWNNLLQGRDSQGGAVSVCEQESDQ